MTVSLSFGSSFFWGSSGRIEKYSLGHSHGQPLLVKIWAVGIFTFLVLEYFAIQYPASSSVRIQSKDNKFGKSGQQRGVEGRSVLMWNPHQILSTRTLRLLLTGGSPNFQSALASKCPNRTLICRTSFTQIHCKLSFGSFGVK